MPRGINFHLPRDHGTMITHIIVFIAWAQLMGIKAEDLLSMSHEIKARIEPAELPQSLLPFITSNSMRQRVLIGSTVHFPCKVENLGSNVVVWKKSPASLQLDNDRSFSVLENNSLQIRSVRSEYAGSYTCTVSSSPPMELTHYLEVLVRPKIITVPANGDVVVEKDESITLICQAEGHPTPIIKWTAKEGNLPRGIPEKQGNRLTIPSADTYHSTEYQCAADNEVGDPVTAVFKVKVLYSPEVKVKPAWLHAGYGSAVEFSCTVSAVPPADITWTRLDGSLLDEDAHVSIQNVGTTSKVKIKGIREEHIGSYNCSANNSLGSSHDKVEISALAELVNFRSNSLGNEDTSIQLLWSVKSYSPVIEYMLRIRRKRQENDFDVPPSPWTEVIIPVAIQQSVLYSQSYMVTGLEPATPYEVVMQARNDFGWNHPSEMTFRTAGREMTKNVMEEHHLEPTATSLLDPITNHQEEPQEGEENDLQREVKGASAAAANHQVPDYIYQVLIVSLPLVVSCQM